MDEFGTMEDIKCLIEGMHKRGMKLIMDLVPNHTSSQHKWFVESRKSKDNPYSDFYYWADQPRNDWRSEFGGSAWQYDEGRGQYYLHSYAVGQPDLNWENPRVIKAIADVVDFWVDLGVDGFRIDVIDQISKDWENNRNYLGPHLHEYINAIFGREKTKHIFTVGECWTDNIDEIELHCAEERGELVTLFQFEHIECGRRNKWTSTTESHYKRLRDIIAKWQTLTQEKELIHSLFTDNHDQNFFISRMGNTDKLRYESATMLATMFYLLKGTAFIYQGQEFGSVGSRFDSLEDFRDIESLNYYKYRINNEGESHEKLMEEINFGSRDNTRRPVAWSNEKYCGFSTAEPWIAPASRSSEINLENDLKSERSVFKFYQELLKLRNTSETIRYGGFKQLNTPDDDFFLYERELDGEKYTVLCNFDKESQIAIPRGELVLSNYNRTADDTNSFRPYELAVYRD